MWWDDVRNPDDALGGVKMLAREIDKLRGELSGAFCALPNANEALLDDVFFSSLGVSRDALADVVRGAWVACQVRNAEALRDLRESVENEPEVRDSVFMARAQASDIDNAVVRWVFDTVGVTNETIAVVNRKIERVAATGSE